MSLVEIFSVFAILVAMAISISIAWFLLVLLFVAVLMAGGALDEPSS